MTKELLEKKRRINYHLSGDFTITSAHGRRGQNPKDNSKFSSHARKGYRIKRSTRRNLLSSAFFLFVKKQHQIIFLTLTFPDRIPKGEKINPMLNRFITNMKKTYGLKRFLWTREDTKRGRPHFHILADMPYKSIQKINNAWCHAIGMQSKNAVRLPKDHKAVLSDIEKTVKYVTKYITKDENNYFKERCYSISHDIKVKPIRLSEFDWEQICIDHQKDLKFRYYDHCITVKLWNYFKKTDYFIEFLGDYTENVTFDSESELHAIAINSSKSDRRAFKCPSFQLDLGFSP